MRLILTRHGETVANVNKIIQGHLPGKLTKKGREMAEKLASRLSKEKIDIIYSSDLSRSADTAKIIHKHHPEIPIVFVEDLREMYWGKLQGRPDTEIDMENLPKDVESLENLYNRAIEFLHKILHKHKDSTVLFVCHAEIGAAVYCAAIGKDVSCINKNLLSNTSITILEISEDNKHKLHIYNSTEHLNK